MDGKQLAVHLGLTESEYDRILELLLRQPNKTELGMFAALWSEHCAYKHSRHLFHLFPTRAPHVLQSLGENAGVVDIGDGLAITFKVESHNSPSAVEPFHGAATGVGGILRDIISMGARPVALLGALRIGSLDDARPRTIFRGVTHGMTDYANNVGVPVIGGQVSFDRSFSSNPLVNVMAIGVVSHDKIATAYAKGVGNDVIVAGLPTGRDGIMGASFSSVDLEDAQAPEKTQTGDPFAARHLIEATLEIISKDLVAGIQDMGAAGLSSSAAEMAAKAGTGIDMDVSLVPRKEEGMTPYEMMLSESQERMLIVAKPETTDEILHIFHQYGLEAEKVGVVTDDGMLRIRDGQEVAAEIPATYLSDEAPSYVTEYRRPHYVDELDHDVPPDLEGDVTDTFLHLLSDLNVASKSWLFRQSDYMAGGRTITSPGSSRAGVIRLDSKGKGIAATVSANSLHAYIDPKRGSFAAVFQAAKELVAVGAKPLALTDGMNFGNPENPDVYWQFHESVEGIAEAAKALQTPVISGNVSFYNESGGQAIMPTPIIGMVGVMQDVNQHVTAAFERLGDQIIVLGNKGGLKGDLGGSRYVYNVSGKLISPLPEVRPDEELAMLDLVRQLIEEGLLRSATAVGEGGLTLALAESSCLGGIGFNVRLEAGSAYDKNEEARLDSLLFGEAFGRMLVSVAPEAVDAVAEKARNAGVPMEVIGEVVGNRLSVTAQVNHRQAHINVPLPQAARTWQGAIPKAMLEEGHEVVF